MDNLLSMKELLVTLRKNWWLALCTLLLGAVIAGGYAYGVQKPSYTYTALAVVQLQKNNTETLSQILNTNTYDSELLESGKSLFKTAAVYDRASATLLTKEQLKISSGDLTKQVKVEHEDNSRAFSILDTDKNAHDAAYIAHEVAAAFTKTISYITKLTDTVNILE